MKRNKKRALSLALALSLVLSLLPTLTLPAAADETTVTTWNDLESACEVGGTVTVVVGADISQSDTDGSRTITVSGNVTLDLNGHSVTREPDDTVGRMFDVRGRLDVEDNSAGGGGSLNFLEVNTNIDAYLVGVYGGTFVLHGGTLNVDGSKTNLFNNGGSLYFFGGTLADPLYLTTNNVNSIVIHAGTFSSIKFPSGYSENGTFNGILGSDATVAIDGTRIPREQFNAMHSASNVTVSNEAAPPLVIEHDYPMCFKGEPIAAYTPKVESNDGAAVWTASGLPAGLSIDSATGAISGTPTAEPGGYEVEVDVKNNLVKDYPSRFTTFTFTMYVTKAQSVGSWDDLKAALEDPLWGKIFISKDISATVTDPALLQTADGTNGALVIMHGSKVVALQGHSVDIKYQPDNQRGSTKDDSRYVATDSYKRYKGERGKHALVYIPHNSSLTVYGDSSGNGSFRFSDDSAFLLYDLSAFLVQENLYFDPGILFYADGKLTIRSGTYSGSVSWKFWSKSAAEYIRRQDNGIVAYGTQQGSVTIYGGYFDGHVAMNNVYLGPEHRDSYGDHVRDAVGDMEAGIGDGTMDGVISGYNLHICGGEFVGRGGAYCVCPAGDSCFIGGGSFSTKGLKLARQYVSIDASGWAATILTFNAFNSTPHLYARTVQAATLPPSFIKIILPTSSVTYDGNSVKVSGDNRLLDADGKELTGPYFAGAVITPEPPELSMTPSMDVVPGNTYTIAATAVGHDGGELSYAWYLNNVLQSETSSSFSYAVPGDAATGTNYFVGCVVTELGSNLSATGASVLVAGAAPTQSPSIHLTPSASTIRADETKTLTASVGMGGYTALQYQWYVDGSPLDGTETWHDLDSANPTVTLTTAAANRLGAGQHIYLFVLRSPGAANTLISFPATVTVAGEYSISIDTCDLYFAKDVADTKTLAVSGCLPEGAEASIGNTTLPTGFKLDSGIANNGDKIYVRYDGTGTAGTTEIPVTVTTSGSYTVTDTKTVRLHVCDAPIINDHNLGSVTVGTEYSHQLSLDDSSSHSSSLRWWVDTSGGPLPNGLSLSADGLISGTPTQPYDGTFSVTVADLAAGTVASKTLTMRVYAAPALYMRNNQVPLKEDITGKKNVPFSGFVGDNLYAYFEGSEKGDTITVTAPDGQELSAVGAVWDDTNKKLSWENASADSSGVYTITLTSPLGAVTTATLEFTVSESLKITTTSQDVDAQLKQQFGSAYVPTGSTVSLTFSCVGDSSKTLVWELADGYSWDAFPTGATITGSSTTGTFTFEMPHEAPGKSMYGFSVKVHYDGGTATESKNFSIQYVTEVSGPTTITQHGSTVMRGMEQFSNAYFTSDAVPTGEATFTATGLPEGLRIGSAGGIYGTTNADADDYTISVTATNNLDSTKTCTQNFTLTVAEPEQAAEPVISLAEGSYDGLQYLTVVSNTAAENYAFIQCVDDKTGQIMAVNKDGTLGDPGSGTGFMAMSSMYNSGKQTPIIVSRSMTLYAYTFGWLQNKTDSAVVTRHYTIDATATPTVHITTDSLPNATIGEDYSASLSAQEEGVTWEVSGLPVGITFNTTAATFGDLTYSAAGNYTVVVKASKEGYFPAVKTLTLTVVKPTQEAASTPSVTVTADRPTATRNSGAIKLTSAVTVNGSTVTDKLVRWYRSDTADGTGTLVGEGSAFMAPTSPEGTIYYYAVAYNAVDGKTTSTGKSNVIELTINAEAAVPSFGGGGEVLTMSVGAARKLVEQATVPDGGAISYQWYTGTSVNEITTPVTTTACLEDGTGSTSGKYAACFVATQYPGTYYYRCRATNNINGLTAENYSQLYTVTVADTVSVEEIYVSKTPNKMVYAVGDTFESDGMVVTAVKSNDDLVELSASDYTATAELTEADHSVTVSYKDETNGTLTADLPLYLELPSAISATVTAPGSGQTPVYDATVPADSHYIASVASWKLTGSSTDMGESDTFTKGQSYTATVTIKSETGYAFSAVPALTVNGQKAVYDETATTAASGAAIYYTVAFTASDGVTVSGTCTSWNGTDNAVYRLYASTVTDADIKTDIKLASPALAQAFVPVKGTQTLTSGSTTQYSQSYSFSAVTPGTYKLAVYKPNHGVRIETLTSASNITDYSVALCLMGDVSQDGKVTLADYGKVLRHVKGLELLTGYSLVCGDVSGDGKITLADYGKILRHVKGLEQLW